MFIFQMIKKAEIFEGFSKEGVTTDMVTVPAELNIK